MQENDLPLVNSSDAEPLDEITDTTKQKLFDTIEAVAKQGRPVDIIGDGVISYISDRKVEGKGDLEVVWSPPDPDFGTSDARVTLTEEIPSQDGKTTRLIDSSYSIIMSPKGSETFKNIDEGIDKLSSELAISRTQDQFNSLTDEERARVAQEAHDAIFTPEANKQYEEDVAAGLHDIGESEAQDLIAMINSSTPVIDITQGNAT